MEKILIVDDSATARMFVVRCLEIVGYTGSTFIETVSGAEALEVLNTEQIDLVITDLNMPEMDGGELVRQIKDNPILSPMPVVVVSSGLNKPRKDELLGLGVLAVLEKPLTPPAMLEALSGVGKGGEGASVDGW